MLIIWQRSPKRVIHLFLLTSPRSTPMSPSPSLTALPTSEQGKICDRQAEGQHYRIAGLNRLTAIIIYLNTVHLGHAVAKRRDGTRDLMFHQNVFPTYSHWTRPTFTAGKYLSPPIIK